MITLTITGTIKTVPSLQILNNEKQTRFCTFGIDFKSPNTKQDVFFPLRINFYGKAAEAVVSKQLAIGEPIIVMGSLITTTKELPGGGKDKKANVEGIFLERLSEANTQPQVPPPTAPPPPPPPTAPPPAAPPQTTPYTPVALESEDIPF